jgi:transcriptional regulator with PAS, ATPase and Fis domain
MNKSIPGVNNEALGILMNYKYPGNIRELANIMERAVILTGHDTTITPNALPKEVIKGAYITRKPEYLLPPEGISLEEVEESFIRQALEMANGNQTNAAKLLGISRHTLLYRMDKFKLKKTQNQDSYD